VCTGLAADENNCGGCGFVCGVGQLCCGAVCRTIAVDPSHCGQCNVTCMSGICEAGACL
jgi:hypothetical protein